MDRCQLAIVIPAYNEEKTIFQVVRSVISYGTPIVVDDGSKDNTSSIAASAGAVVVSLLNNFGYDEALNSGLKKAFELDHTVIVTFDADGQHDASLIPKFCDEIEAGSDVVVGVRNHRQRFSEHFFAWYTSVRFKIRDPLCGMKAYRKIIYDSLGYFDSYGSTGTELMIFAAKNRFRLGEVDIRVHEREDAPRFGRNYTGDYKIIRAMVLSLWKIRKIIR